MAYLSIAGVCRADCLHGAPDPSPLSVSARGVSALGLVAPSPDPGAPAEPSPIFPAVDPPVPRSPPHSMHIPRSVGLIWEHLLQFHCNTEAFEPITRRFCLSSRLTTCSTGSALRHICFSLLTDAKILFIGQYGGGKISRPIRRRYTVGFRWWCHTENPPTLRHLRVRTSCRRNFSSLPTHLGGINAMLFTQI